MPDVRFHWADYLVLTLTLLMSSAVGVYYAIIDQKRKRNNTENFLMGGRRMPVLPVSISMFVSWFSAISFLGDPVEVYYQGLMYWIIGIGYCVALPLVAHFFAPMFHKMKVVSANEVRIPPSTVIVVILYIV